VWLASASGLLLAFSFPQYGHPAVAWIALAPLIRALQSGSLLRAFGSGWLCGVVYFTGTLYWITHVMVRHGGLQQWVAVLVNAALIAYLALFPALFALALRRIHAAFGDRALMAAPLLWVATELGRTYLFTGFPWVLLGYSQVSMLPIAQLASVVGVYGLSALVTGVSAAAVVLATGRGRDRFVPAIAVAALIVSAAVWGGARLGRQTLTRAGQPVTVGLVQGNVEQEAKWDPAHAPAIFQRYLRMTREAIAAGAEFVLWPESSTPFQFGESPAGSAEILRIAREGGVTILLGSDEIERGSARRYYNSAFLIRPDGSVADSYRKMHLVPFGEYVPLRRLFFFAAPLVEAVSAFSPGESRVLLPVGDRRVSTAICYEIVYPDLVRRFVRDGSELLTTITNDAWFGRTSAPHQHFAQASMRAIENGRYLVRAANTGISGVVDPYGRVIAASGLFEPAVLVSRVRFQTGSTLYARTGDVFAYACTVIGAALLVAARRRVQWTHGNG
jgi:apolipoprotein N-acyltransferase